MIFLLESEYCRLNGESLKKVNIDPNNNLYMQRSVIYTLTQVWCRTDSDIFSWLWVNTSRLYKFCSIKFRTWHIWKIQFIFRWLLLLLSAYLPQKLFVVSLSRDVSLEWSPYLFWCKTYSSWSEQMPGEFVYSAGAPTLHCII